VYVTSTEYTFDRGRPPLWQRNIKDPFVCDGAAMRMRMRMRVFVCLFRWDDDDPIDVDR